MKRILILSQSPFENPSYVLVLYEAILRILLPVPLTLSYTDTLKRNYFFPGTNATTTKRASSRNARQLVSKWCEGLAGKPRHAKWNHVKKWSSKNVGLTTTNGGNRLQHDKASRKSRITNVHCPKCGKFYKCRSSLSSHAKFECGKTAECLCKLCQYRTHYPSYLKKHMIRKHKMLAKLIDIV